MRRDPAFDLLGDPSQWTMSHVLRCQAARHGERRFVSFGDGTELSFAGYDAQCDRLARALLAAGLQAGDRVLSMLRNRAEFLLLAIACGRAGAIFVPVNTELKGFSLQHQLHNCGARMVVLEADLVAHFDGVAVPEAVPARVVVLGGEPGALPPALGTGPAISFESLCALADGAAALHKPAAHEVGCIMYTSGTTGPAKGVLMPHAHLALFSVPSPGLALTEADTYYVCRGAADPSAMSCSKWRSSTRRATSACPTARPARCACARASPMPSCKAISACRTRRWRPCATSGSTPATPAA
jgi:crotonobetaine/carnitine-CoA ligase